MKKIHIIFIPMIILLCFTSCKDYHLNSDQRNQEKELTHLVGVMSGEFSSSEQAELDTSFYNINLVMYPIWEKDEQAKWLYVEQAVTEYIDQPYRQRVYKLSKSADGLIESKVYKLSDPSKYIHAWKEPSIFDQLTPDSLIIREGCSVFLKRNSGDCYIGSTKDKECKSTMRGAQYATSEVKICPDQVMSWDQGWDDSDTQVWGAEKEGYVFKRMSKEN